MPYFEKIRKQDKEYKELIYSLAENGKATLTEMENFSLMQRIEYQNFVVNKLNKKQSGKYNN